MKKDYLLTEQQIIELQSGKFYGLFAEPGAGKTKTFENVIIPVAKEEGKNVLYLSPRSSLKVQTLTNTSEARTEKFYGFDREKLHIKTYQHIQNEMEKGNSLPKYDYIVADEAHYLVADHWNEKTHLAVQFLEESQAVKLLMTGTPDILTHYINKWHVQTLRELNRSKTRVKRIELYSDEKQMIERIKNSQHEKCKFLTFKPGKIKDTKKLANKLGGSFLCSPNNKDNMYDDVDKNLVQAISDAKESLPAENIVSTSVIEEGINIEDPNFQMVASFEPKLIENVIQQAARIRKSNVTLLIFVDNVNSYTGLIKKNKERLENSFEAQRAYLTFQNEQLNSINQTPGDNHVERYRNYLKQYFPTAEIVDMNKKVLKEQIENRLSNLIDLEIYKEDINNDGIVQSDLIKIFVEEFGARGNQRQKNIGKKKMADFLNEYNTNIALINKQNQKMQKTYWKLIKN
ncbi:superfamily II DNA or RNA helicase [Sinobaca qinghaiensis]|uniref:Superfamily II DNA or RNA helicase n=1 Tax=Sinobaca qinghaiensis TaxID=342944 RepID=A0A419VTU3_9BACL|nr:DEAD/DEAH box helicase family protein [Sinobaca qinghaiensis]RKD84130.1 superfamily II DNA or RNA helicase [Sinobaca qinghaiensis]